MLKKATLLAGAGAAAGMLAMAPMASADSADSDGVGVANDTNLSVLPVQACGNNIAVLGVVADVLSPDETSCTNAPMVDHPSEQG